MWELEAEIWSTEYSFFPDIMIFDIFVLPPSSDRCILFLRVGGFLWEAPDFILKPLFILNKIWISSVNYSMAMCYLSILCGFEKAFKTHFIISSKVMFT